MPDCSQLHQAVNACKARLAVCSCSPVFFSECLISQSCTTTTPDFLSFFSEDFITQSSTTPTRQRSPKGTQLAAIEVEDQVGIVPDTLLHVPQLLQQHQDNAQILQCSTDIHG